MRRIALSLPETTGAPDRFACSVLSDSRQKGFVWAWNVRVQPKKPKVPRADVIAVRVADRTEKAALWDLDPDKCFTEPHHKGFPAVLVRLPAVGVGELRDLIVDAWRCQAPKALAMGYGRGEAGWQEGRHRPEAAHLPMRRAKNGCSRGAPVSDDSKRDAAERSGPPNRLRADRGRGLRAPPLVSVPISPRTVALPSMSGEAE